MLLKILEYHSFHEKPDKYIYSRTYDQFLDDITHPFDWITMDDGRIGQIKACELLRERNIRAKLGINLELLGQPGYMNWEDVVELSKYHDIENHGTMHAFHTQMHPNDIRRSIDQANKEIEEKTGRKPRYFIPPYNQTDHKVEEIAHELGLRIIVGRETITNETLW